MEVERSGKRRKLDPLAKESRKAAPAVASPHPKPFTYPGPRASTGKTNSDPAVQPLADRSPHKSAHDAWRDAKAQSLARRGRKLEVKGRSERDVDVYDDVEGAHTHKSPAKSSPHTSTPSKKQLDPLRNQKIGEQASTPSKSRTSLDSFKQFSSPKSVPIPGASKADSRTDRAVNGRGKDAVQQEDKHAKSSKLEDSRVLEDVGGSAVQDSPSRPSTKAKWKGWAYERPKKTFEDEIRELENVARREADQDGDSEAPGSALQTRSVRASASNTSTAVESITTKKDAKLANQRSLDQPAKRKPRIDDQPRLDKDSILLAPDAMEVDGPENGVNIEPTHMFGHKAATAIATPTKIRPQPDAKFSESLKSSTFAANHLCVLQKILMEKLIGKRPVRLINLDDEYVKVSNVITQTITAGESNSMLLIGARGSGKSSLINQILHEQSAKHADDFHVVCLNGFIHTDDKIALREIWRQLGRDMELDEDDSTSKNYADTMTRLLALLSHPAEQGREQTDQVTKSVVFVLDEFELFASHPRQTLLYNLFDIAQSRKAPIAVLGLTTRIDVAEGLEKRVKSRFSHRYVHLSSAKSFAAFQDACRAAMALDQTDLLKDEREQLGLSSQGSSKLDNTVKEHNQNIITTWNKTIEALFVHEEFTSHMKRLYYTTKAVPDFHASMMMPLATLPVSSTTNVLALIDHFIAKLGANPLRSPDSKLSTLTSLSTLQLALLICAARLTNIHNCESVPFSQAYEEYKVLASKAKLQASASGALAQGAASRVSSKDVAKGAWEELIEIGLIMDEGARGGRVDVGLEEIGMSGVDLGGWAKWCREI